MKKDELIDTVKEICDEKGTKIQGFVFLRKKNTGVKNPYLSRKAVEKAEAETAERLRKRGYGVWSN